MQFRLQQKAIRREGALRWLSNDGRRLGSFCAQFLLGAEPILFVAAVGSAALDPKSMRKQSDLIVGK